MTEEHPAIHPEAVQYLGYAEWLQDVGTRMQEAEMEPSAHEFGRNLLEVAHFMRQQHAALQVIMHMTNQQAQPEPASEIPEDSGDVNYPSGTLHKDPKIALMLADGEFVESVALLSYRHHQAAQDKPEDSTVEALGRNIVMFLTSLRHSPELLGKFAAAFNYYSNKVQERMTTGLNALSDTIH